MVLNLKYQNCTTSEPNTSIKNAENTRITLPITNIHDIPTFLTELHLKYNHLKSAAVSL